MTNAGPQLTSLMIQKHHMTNTGPQLTSLMIQKHYVTHAKPQLTSLMIQKCYVTHAGQQLIFKKLKFVLTRNLKFEYNVHSLTFWVLLSDRVNRRQLHYQLARQKSGLTN